MLAVRRTDSCLEIEGALDGEGAQDFLRAVESERGPVRVDASRVARIDAEGLTALAVARSRCRADGRAFALTRVAPEAIEGLRTRDHVLTIFGPRAEEPRARVARARRRPI